MVDSIVECRCLTPLPIRKWRKVRGREAPRAGGTARKPKTQVDLCRAEPGPWPQASVAGRFPITRERNGSRARSTHPKEGPSPKCPRNASTHHPPRRGCPSHTHGDRAGRRRDRGGGERDDPRVPGGSVPSVAGVHGKMPAAKRPPAATPPCTEPNARGKDVVRQARLQGLIMERVTYLGIRRPANALRPRNKRCSRHARALSPTRNNPGVEYPASSCASRACRD